MRAHLGLVFLVTWMSLIMLLLLFANSAIGGLRTQLTALDARVDAILRSQTRPALPGALIPDAKASRCASSA